ncbi:MAG: hypothetical protein EBS22_02385 [Acidimicrobiia bacterium]|nr:hypothetical protein [Acidimicrobiia bacterium]
MKLTARDTTPVAAGRVDPGSISEPRRGQADPTRAASSSDDVSDPEVSSTNSTSTESSSPHQASTQIPVGSTEAGRLPR